MSLPDEIVNAQERVYKSFVSRELSFKLWPKHFINGGQLQHLYEEIERLEQKNKRLIITGDKLAQRIEDEYPAHASEQCLVRDWKSIALKTLGDLISILPVKDNLDEKVGLYFLPQLCVLLISFKIFLMTLRFFVFTFSNLQ